MNRNGNVGVWTAWGWEPVHNGHSFIDQTIKFFASLESLLVLEDFADE